jgi:hypothetical protein
MLKLDPIGSSQHVIIRYQKRSTLFDRALQRAFLYSVLFHALVFGLFRIKFLELPLTSSALNPVEVALDAEKPDESMQETVAVAPTEERPTAPRDEQALLSIPIDRFGLTNTFLFQTAATPPSTTVLSDNETQVLSLLAHDKQEAKEIPFTERLYPLRLQISGDAASLSIIEDGSILFKERAAKHKTTLFKLATNTFPIEYRIVVSSESGTIIQWSRKKELLDKQLQNCADKLIHMIRFAPRPWPGKKAIRGKLWIIFACTGHELREYLR